MRNDAYWKQRFEQLEEAQHKKAVELFVEIENNFHTAQREIEKNIEIWFKRLADNNGISLHEARKLLNKNELREFKWDVNEYIKRGKENAVNQQWIKELENASAKYHISRLEAMKINVRCQLEEIYTEYHDTVKDTMTDIYESEYLHTAYEVQAGIGLGFNVSKPDKRQIDKILSKPWAADGYNFSERIWTNKNKLISEAYNILSVNLITGADPQKAINALAKKMKTSRYNAGRLVMTEQAYFSSLSRGECFNDLGIEEYKIIATLDDRTSEICRSMDLKVFSMKDFQAGVTAPPFHVYCRSTTAPHFKNNYGVVGQRAARDAETGKTYYVPADMPYNEWESQYVNNKPATSINPTQKEKSNFSASQNKAPEFVIGQGSNIKSSGKTYHDEKIPSKTAKPVDNSGERGIMKVDSNKAKIVDIFNDNDVSENSEITAEKIVEELKTTKIGKETLNDIENLPHRIRLTDGAAPAGIRGEENGGEISIYLENCKNVVWAARTVIHENTHYKYGISNSQWAECVCIAQELKHARNIDKLSIADLRKIVGAVKSDDDYKKLNWRKGGTVYGRRSVGRKT